MFIYFGSWSGSFIVMILVLLFLCMRIFSKLEKEIILRYTNRAKFYLKIEIKNNSMSQHATDSSADASRLPSRNQFDKAYLSSFLIISDGFIFLFLSLCCMDKGLCSQYWIAIWSCAFPACWSFTFIFFSVCSLKILTRIKMI